MIKRVETAFSDGRLLQEFVPCPAELLDERTGSFGGDDAEEKDQLREELTKKYGYSGWYDWQVANWGTKWDVGDGDGINEVTENSITVYFDSAWAPPVAAYEKLTDMGFRVDAMYHEPGVAFAGIYKDGEDDCYDLSGLDSDQVKEQIPHGLDQAFGISEMMEEWEAEDDVE
jgi:hypothetical protein